MRTLILVITFATAAPYALAQTILTYVSTDVPINIPDGPDGIAESRLEIGDYYMITDIDVVLSIAHTFDQDLRIYLEAPNDEVVRMAYECGEFRDNYTDTRFDDEAELFICDGVAPFSGSFRPEHPLDAFDNRRMNGTWILRVTDNWHSQVGGILAWRMEITVDTTVAAHEPPVAEDFSVGPAYPNPFNATTVLPIALEYPAAVKLTVYTLGGALVEERLFGLTAGRHEVTIDGGSWSSGTYFARVETGALSRVTRLVLLK